MSSLMHGVEAITKETNIIFAEPVTMTRTEGHLEKEYYQQVKKSLK